MLGSMSQILKITTISIVVATLAACAESPIKPDTSNTAAKPAAQAPVSKADTSKPAAVQAPVPKNTQGKVVESDALRMGKGCPAVGAVKSLGPKNPTWKVTFVNKIKSGGAATIYWLNPDGEPVETEIFDDKGQAVIDTNAGQAYIVKDFAGTCYGGVHVINKGQTQVVVGDSAERISFAKGKSSATVSGKLAGFDDEQNYVIATGKGQAMTVEALDKQSDGRVSIYITDPKGENANDMDLSCHSNATVKPTLAGDYQIQVVECKKADPWKGKFAFNIKVK